MKEKDDATASTGVQTEDNYTTSTGLDSRISGWTISSRVHDASTAPHQSQLSQKEKDEQQQDVPTKSIVVVSSNGKQPPPPPEDISHRAVHKIRLSALEHNYAQVEAAANRQRCSVIVVVKADGYGHGAIATALHLADACGADAFAVATLEEGIALRKAFENNPPGKWSKNLAALFHTQEHNNTTTTITHHHHQHHHPSGTVVGSTTSRSQSPTCEATALVMRPPRIRILVLGPPVGFPRCFDDYYHHDIEVMVSGPEVAQALMEWVVDEKERKRTQVERAATEAKAQALAAAHVAPRDPVIIQQRNDNNKAEQARSRPDTPSTKESSDNSNPHEACHRQLKKHQSSTLGNVQGQDLAREVRTILMNQSKVVATEQQAAELAKNSNSIRPPRSGATSVCNSSDSSVGSDPKNKPTTTTVSANTAVAPTTSKPAVTVSKPSQVFGGIEAAANISRRREMAAARATGVFHEDEDNDDDEDDAQSAKSSTSRHLASNTSSNIHKQPLTYVAAAQAATASAVPVPPPPPGAARKKSLRWHALVDTGMGRLGFRTQIPPPKQKDKKKDTVEILKELVDAEVHANAPIEFFGMCTHMADAANSASGFTKEQITKFISLLKRVRAAKIFIPTVSTDNSAALLTTNLTHFDPKAILSQSHADTRGYVRTGGAIYGQRPAFKQLRAVSTLLASVRHVAILKKGETVGYDRAYTAPYDVRIATLTIGFADGYPRELGNGVGKVAIRGEVFPVAGNVCMDMMMVELGPAEDKTGVGASVAVRDTAVLWGPLDEDEDKGLVRLQDIAATLKTTQSALTCGLDKIRVRRKFV